MKLKENILEQMNEIAKSNGLVDSGCQECFRLKQKLEITGWSYHSISRIYGNEKGYFFIEALCHGKNVKDYRVGNLITNPDEFEGILGNWYFDDIVNLETYYENNERTNYFIAHINDTNGNQYDYKVLEDDTGWKKIEESIVPASTVIADNLFIEFEQDDKVLVLKYAGTRIIKPE